MIHASREPEARGRKTLPEPEAREVQVKAL